MEAFALILMIFGSIFWMGVIACIVTLYLHEQNEEEDDRYDYDER